MHVLNILWVVFGIGLMLVLNLRFKINSMVALLLAALSVGMLAGMDLMELLHTMKSGFGSTLGELAIIVVFGAVIGKLMVDSGAAHQIAHTLLARLGLRQCSLLFGQPLLGGALAFWMGNPLLNPATLVFMGFVLGWHFAFIRLVAGQCRGMFQQFFGVTHQGLEIGHQGFLSILCQKNLFL
mgnify:CR=1 FL=1